MSKFYCALQKGLRCNAEINGFCTKWGHCDDKRSVPVERPVNFDKTISELRKGHISSNELLVAIRNGSFCNKKDDSIDVIEFNSAFYPICSKARSFVRNLNHALDKSGDEAKYQAEVVGWDETTKDFILKAIEYYEQNIRNCIKRKE